MENSYVAPGIAQQWKQTPERRKFRALPLALLVLSWECMVSNRRSYGVDGDDGLLTRHVFHEEGTDALRFGSLLLLFKLPKPTPLCERTYSGGAFVPRSRINMQSSVSQLQTHRQSLIPSCHTSNFNRLCHTHSTAPARQRSPESFVVMDAASYIEFQQTLSYTQHSTSRQRSPECFVVMDALSTFTRMLRRDGRGRIRYTF